MIEDQRKTLSLKAAYAFGKNHGLESAVDEIRNMDIEWDLSYTSSLRRGYIIELFEKQGLFEAFKSAYWPYGNTPGGENKKRRSLKIKQQYEDFLAGRNGQEEIEEEVEEEEAEQAFAAETDLRDFLAENLSCIEQGLSLYQTEGRSGIEFPVENGRIDILAVDKEKRLVVIELKVGRGRNRTIGQLLYYMGWVDQHLGNGPCRGMIIAREVPDDLKLAVQRVPGVSLARYHLKVSVEFVSLK